MDVVVQQQQAYLAHHDDQARQSEYAAGEQREREAVREQRFGDSEAGRDAIQQVPEAGEIAHVAWHRYALRPSPGCLEKRMERKTFRGVKFDIEIRQNLKK